MHPASPLTLVVMAKECIPGQVKTRLTPPLSHALAADVAAASLDDTLATVAALPVARRVLAYTTDRRPALAAGFELLRQPDGDLDQRLAAVFDAARGYGWGTTVLIGMDTPQLRPDHLAACLKPAPGVDSWIGLAGDGGFWALALRNPDGDLTRGVPMSAPTTGARQLERLLQAGHRVRLLPQLTDVDTIGTAAQVSAQIPHSRFTRALQAALAQRPAGRP
ncbi:TIGR04282 family arsenosugar biosynthesis glycosyltransferase [Pseudarthrobacter sp. S9]|uniref:TIGR04282 family arsenosugar biosynthesis glycosyltransferase n=1 Tax=Pseudarthrobacter sp. S9 TaxID=3418421 RepID=UPI003CFD19C3